MYAEDVGSPRDRNRFHRECTFQALRCREPENVPEE
jgi:hypothetical protein